MKILLPFVQNPINNLEMLRNFTNNLNMLSEHLSECSKFHQATDRSLHYLNAYYAINETRKAGYLAYETFKKKHTTDQNNHQADLQQTATNGKIIALVGHLFNAITTGSTFVNFIGIELPYEHRLRMAAQVCPYITNYLCHYNPENEYNKKNIAAQITLDKTLNELEIPIPESLNVSFDKFNFITDIASFSIGIVYLSITFFSPKPSDIKLLFYVFFIILTIIEAGKQFILQKHFRERIDGQLLQ